MVEALDARVPLHRRLGTREAAQTGQETPKYDVGDGVSLVQVKLQPGGEKINEEEEEEEEEEKVTSMGQGRV